MHGEEKKITNIFVEETIVVINEGEHHHGHHHHKHPNPTELVFSGIKYKHLTIKKSKIMSLALDVNSFAIATLGIVDHVTQLPVDATFANIELTPDDATIVSTDPATGKIVGLAAGTTNLTAVADVTYTNSLNVQVTEKKSATSGITVTAVAVANGVDLVVSFSTPAPVTP